MGRIRSIKPEFFTDFDLCQLPPLHRLLFAGLWCHEDRAGRVEDKPRELKVKILPFDDVDPEIMLQELHLAGFIHRYEVEGKKYLCTPTFGNHQSINNREPPSAIPPPSPSKSATRGSRVKGNLSGVKVASHREGKGKDGKGREGNEATASPLTPQAELPGVESELTKQPEPTASGKKKRAPSEQQAFASWFEERRKEALGEDWSADKNVSVQRLNTELRWVTTEDEEVVGRAVELYLKDPYRRGQSPPFCLLWFCRDRVDYVDPARLEVA